MFIYIVIVPYEMSREHVEKNYDKRMECRAYA